MSFYLFPFFLIPGKGVVYKGSLIRGVARREPQGPPTPFMVFFFFFFFFMEKAVLN